ncbi:MAG: agmatine deiminase family protein [Fluviicola sp.]
MPGEDFPHKGTWLQWPHNDLYGPFYQDDVTPTFVGMVAALQLGEEVYIIAKNQTHQNQIEAALTNASVPLTNITFYHYPTDDVWVRDNGPIFVFDDNDELRILDWGFNGWGNDAPYYLCDSIPGLISNELQIPSLDLSAMVLEGGAIEHDGQGTIMATRSSVTHSSRNPNLTEQQIEAYLAQYMGFTKFIWLDGVYGTEITDMHIDGFVKFANDSTIVTMSGSDLTYWQVPMADQAELFNASNANNEAYNFVTVPLTQNNVTTAYGNNLGYKGSYCNYYIGNDVVIVPTYNDPNDSLAMGIIQNVHPNRTVVGVDVRNIYEYGGMIHCLTQQQPLDPALVGLNENLEGDEIAFEISPNPTSGVLNIEFAEAYSGEISVSIFQLNGQEVLHENLTLNTAKSTSLNLRNVADGVYLFQIAWNGKQSKLHKMVIHQ